MSCLHLKSLTIAFATPDGVLRAVDRVDLDHREGETLALIGETGCGKSVIAMAVMGLLPENASASGEVRFRDRNLLELPEHELVAIRGSEIAILLQNPTLALNPIQTIGRQIAEPLVVHRRMNRKAALPRVHAWLTRLGFDRVEERLDSYPFELSGGMNQRVLAAASLIAEPAVLIADEPTTGLDPETAAVVADELEAVKERTRASLFLITHDLDLAARLADRIAVMYAGQIVEIAPAHELYEEPLHPYTRALFESRPENGFHPIPGPPISMTALPTGCRFCPRCPVAERQCDKNEPKLVETDGRSVRCVKY